MTKWLQPWLIIHNSCVQTHLHYTQTHIVKLNHTSIHIYQPRTSIPSPPLHNYFTLTLPYFFEFLNMLIIQTLGQFLLPSCLSCEVPSHTAGRKKNAAPAFPSATKPHRTIIWYSTRTHTHTHLIQHSLFFPHATELLGLVFFPTGLTDDKLLCWAQY